LIFAALPCFMSLEPAEVITLMGGGGGVWD
jgi:hypothetical protein